MQYGQHPVRLIMISLGGLAAFLVLSAILLDHGEIVTLETVDEAGRSHDTQLWVAYLDRTPYLRAGNPESSWLERVRAHPEVELDVRGGVQRFHATLQDDSAVLERLNRVMAQKYGLADDIWGLVADRSQSVPIRLERIDVAALRGSP
ncbi:MAG: hypothetical protein JRG96_11190 [Deltaproteobacteria bacterium]|nr:hypothetical protein [Deltaproteobacteria bacterium]